ncbi:hypothetical protein Bca4012_045797 [Brassica carinata]
MSFSFFKPSRPKTPQEVVKAIRDSLLALDTKTVVEVKALEKALEEVEKNFSFLRGMLSGDGEAEPNADQAVQLALEFCKEDVISLVIHKLHILGWETRKDLLHCWSILLKQKVGEAYCCVQYFEEHFELLDCLVVCYDNKEIALHCGSMLRECIKFPMPFQDLLTKHDTVVSEFLTSHYPEFFDIYERLLTSSNYVTRRQSLKLLSDFLLEPPNSHIMKKFILEVRYMKVIMTLLKDSSKNIQISAFHIFKIFVANPSKPQEVKIILARNHEKLLELLHNLSPGKGSEDDQFEEEKELIIEEIQKMSRLKNLQL